VCDGLQVDESTGVGVEVRVSEMVGVPRERDGVVLCVDCVTLPVSVGALVGVVEHEEEVDCDPLADLL